MRAGHGASLLRRQDGPLAVPGAPRMPARACPAPHASLTAPVLPCGAPCCPQIVGRCVSVAREVMETQQKVPFIVSGVAGVARPAALLPAAACSRAPFLAPGWHGSPGWHQPACAALGRGVAAPRRPAALQVTSGMYDSLDPSVAGELTVLGSMPLRCCPGEQEQLYSLPRYTALPMSKLRLEEGPHPFHVAAGVGGDAKLSKSPEGAAAAEQQPKQQQWAARATYTYVAGVLRRLQQPLPGAMRQQLQEQAALGWRAGRHWQSRQRWRRLEPQPQRTLLPAWRRQPSCSRPLA